MAQQKPALAERFFKDRTGRVVLWQWPNVPLYGWIVFKLLALVLARGKLRNGSEQLSTALLFVWAYLELTKGVNYFRRLLGLIVLISLAVGFFK